MALPEKPLLRVTVFSDYLCPFCYLGCCAWNGCARITSCA